MKHPSEVRNRKTTSKPLIDLGLSPQTQQDVLDRIQASLQGDTDSPTHLDGADEVEYAEEEEDEDEEGGGEEFEEEEYGEDGDVEFVTVRPGEEIKDPKEEFWDEFFDSLMLTVPFTFLYLLLDM